MNLPYSNVMRFELPKWYDLHVHFRQDELIAPLIADHLAMGCAGVLAMPNTKPPVAKVHERDDLPYWSIEHYLETLMEHGGDAFDDIIVPLYITKDTTPQMIEAGAKSGLLRAVKYYPPHGTTGADFGAPLETYIESDVFKALEEHDVNLCIHGEMHGLVPEVYFDRQQNAEEIFYTQSMPRLIDKFPNLRIVGEHLTTKVGVEFIQSAPDHVSASGTPQHLLYTVGHLLKGLHYHLYCLPLLKYEEDRGALRDAVTSSSNTKFFAGTDSAPHTDKMTACGCAAGCYTGGIAPQLYASAFEEAGVDLSTEGGQAVFKAFLCSNGPRHYGLPVSTKTFTLEKAPQTLKPLRVGNKEIVPLPVGLNDGKTAEINWRIVS
jgi:dihydroorotase